MISSPNCDPKDLTTENPWLRVALKDYELHMSSEFVQQSGALADLLERAVALRKPRSIAILGIAGGNGLDRLRSSALHRIVGVDVNPTYLKVVRKRYSDLDTLELHRFDLSRQAIHVESVDLVHAALIFEHAGIGLCLQNAVSLVSKGGALSIVLQLAGSSTASAVGGSGIASIERLAPHFKLVDPALLQHALGAHSFTLQHEEVRLLVAGKRLWLGMFVRLGASGEE